jgi:hypothetical protein
MYYSPTTDAKQNPARSSGVLVCHEPDQSGTSFCRSPVLGIVDVGHLRSRRGPDYSAAELTAQGPFRHEGNVGEGWTPSERQDVGTGSRTLTWASLVVLEMGEGGEGWTAGRSRTFVRS